MADKPKWHHIATRLDDSERDELEAYRVEHGLKSLNSAVRHWLQGRRGERKPAAV